MCLVTFRTVPVQLDRRSGFLGTGIIRNVTFPGSNFNIQPVGRIHVMIEL